MNNKWGQQNMAIVDKMAVSRGSTVLPLLCYVIQIQWNFDFKQTSR